MAPSTRECGTTIWPMVRAVLFTREAMSTKDNGLTTKPKAKVYTFIKMEPLILVNGSMISSTAMELKNGSMVHSMKVTSTRDSRKAMVLSLGPTEANTKGNSKTIISKDSAIMFGWMAESMRDHGETIRCMAEEFSFGQMAENTKGSTSMTRSRVTANSAGLMEDRTKDNGKTGNKMGRVHTAIRKVSRRMESG